VKRQRRRAGLVAGALVMAGAFGYLLYGGLGENLVYFVTPSELLARGAEAHGAPVRLGGEVKPGTVLWDAAALDLRFELTDGERAVPVRARAAPPQMFRDGQGVVVEGRWTSEGVFESTNLMVMHSNEYRAADPHAAQGETFRHLPRR
jgi:cytochrome c-type biogenesis protein CcmE